MRLREPEGRAEPGLLTSRVKSNMRASGLSCSSICLMHLSSQGGGVVSWGLSQQLDPLSPASLPSCLVGCPLCFLLGQ